MIASFYLIVSGFNLVITRKHIPSICTKFRCFASKCCCGKLTCTNTVVITWPPLNILVNRPCSSWPTLMGRECKRRIIRRQTPYRISVLQFVLLSIYGNVH